MAPLKSKEYCKDKYERSVILNFESKISAVPNQHQYLLVRTPIREQEFGMKSNNVIYRFSPGAIRTPLLMDFIQKADDPEEMQKAFCDIHVIVLLMFMKR